MRPEVLPLAHTLIQVAPPGEGGVRDYLECLQAAWAMQGWPSQVVALSQAQARHRSLAERIADCAGDATGPCSVVLHFSGYGYEKRGLCFWLLDQLNALRSQRRGGLRLVVVFHELFASGGPPWRSAFWLSRWQESIAARLAGMADAVWTNTEQHAGWLRAQVRAGLPINVRPVISNVGEPQTVQVPGARLPCAVVFGLASTRQRVFDQLGAREPMLHRLGVTELIEVGNGAASKSRLSTIPRRHTGRLSQPDLSRLLQQSRFGLLDYPSRYLGKSGVFAAYASHGCVVLDTSPPGPDTDGLSAGSDYLCLPAMTGKVIVSAQHDAMAAHLMAWYAGHRLADQAKDLLALAVAR